MNHRFVRSLFLSAGMLATAAPALAAPLDADVTYQGKLVLNGAPVNNTADFRFRLFNAAAAGAAQTGNIAVNNVQVVEGVFTVNIDFGFDVFQDDEQLFMEIQVRSPAGAGLFTTLTPRQAVTPSPFAVAARRGFVPWIVQTPGTDESVTIDPDALQDIVTVVRDGVQVASLEQSGAAGGGVFRTLNEATSQLTAFWGTAFNDQSGLGALGAKDLSVFQIPVFLDADGDDDGSNGIFEGEISLSSFGVGGTGGRLQVFNNSNNMTFEIRGGANAAGASLNLLDPADGSSLLNIEPNFGTAGTQIFGFSPTGSEQYRLEPDNDTDGGGFFLVDSGTAGFGQFVVDGNRNNSGSPELRMSGTSDFTVDCSSTGNASVIMPNNAVASGEILDEPGVANNQAGAFVGITVPAATGSLASRSITVPAAGFVLVLAQGDCAINHVTGTASNCNFGVTDTAASLNSTQDILFRLPASAPSGVWDTSAAAHGLFEVSAGTHTFHFSGNFGGAAAADATMFDIQITLVYFPTAYGTTVPNLAERAAMPDDHTAYFNPLTPQEIALERAEGEAFGRMRMQEEIAALKAEMDALKAMLRNDPNLQPQAAPMRAAPVTPVGGQFGPAGNITAAPEPQNVPDAGETDAPAAE